MAQPPANVAALLAALSGVAQQRPASQGPQPNMMPPNLQAPGQGGAAVDPLAALQGLFQQQQQQQSNPGTGASSYPLPQPTNSGSLDLSNIKPTNSGTVSLQDAIAKAKNFASERGVQPGAYRQQEPPRNRGYNDQYGRPSRSRSRSPGPGRMDHRDTLNPYRDERRVRNTYNNSPQNVRDRSFSPPGRGGGGGRRSPPRGYRDRSPQEGNTTEIMMIDAGLVGLIIGRKGETLKRVEEMSGARVQFVTDNMQSAERICNITGTRPAIQSARQQISTIISENSAASIRDDRGYNMPKKANNPPPVQSHHPPLKDGEDSMQIMVPDRTVGLIIGRRGETIQDLQEKSGCHINIVGESKSINGYRPVNLIGSVEAAARARALIMEIVESDVKPGASTASAASSASGMPRQDRGMGNMGGSGGYNDNNYGNNRGDKSSETIRVPLDAVGMIIGKGGETIKEMQSSTGCRINVSGQSHPSDPDREISLQGTPDAINRARRAIEDKVDEARNKNNSGNNRNDRGGNRGGDNYGDRYQNPYQQASASAPPPESSAPPGAGSGADPYAPYGGYQQYVQMYYAAILAQQQQGQQGGAQGEQRLPGAPGT